MAAEEPRTKKHSKSHRGRSKHHERRESRVLSFLRGFWFEILAFVLFGLGVFLLVERLQIKAILWRWTLRALEALGTTAAAIGHRIVDNLIADEKSDLVGIALILAALVMVGSRLRARAILRHPPPALKEECPKCKADMVRAPRRFAQRVLEYALWIRIRRYACSKCAFRTASWHRTREEE